ncbi:MAG: hypothetical protein Kow0099_20170 [Candidatus Abyssubacteria bacterium]
MAKPMKAVPKTNHLYNDLAWLWPLWRTLEHYREESELFASLIREHALRYEDAPSEPHIRRRLHE